MTPRPRDPRLLLAAAAAAVVGPALFIASPAAADVTTNVPAGELAGYQMLYDMDLPATGSFNNVTYNVNNSASIAPGSFGRIAYYLELNSAANGTQWVYASMDRFTPYATRAGIPTTASGAIFQKGVSNLNVYSNVPGITTGTGRTGYNVEFWPTDYSAPNARGVANASATLYDWGDSRTLTGSHGSMQLHDSANSQVLFAFNNWGNGASTTNAMALGIGNNTVSAGGAVNPDWTFRGNGGDYSVRRMQVLVGGAPPALPAGTGAPAHVYTNAPETQGMVHTHTLAIPQAGNAWNANGVPYSVDKSAQVAPGSFDRVGYYLELQPTAGGPLQYAFVSMDAFTSDPSKIGIPATDTNVLFQQAVANMNVTSNVSSVVNGVGMTTGNIEFWPSNYASAKAAASPTNASDGTFDFGDSGAGLGSGYGSFQIHNADVDGTGPGTAGQTIIAIDRWGAAAAADNVEIGIGNAASGNPDYTFANNGGTFTVRNLYVFVHPTAVPEPAAAGLLAAGAGLLALRRKRDARA